MDTKPREKSRPLSRFGLAIGELQSFYASGGAELGLRSASLEATYTGGKIDPEDRFTAPGALARAKKLEQVRAALLVLDPLTRQVLQLAFEPRNHLVGHVGIKVDKTHTAIRGGREVEYSYVEYEDPGPAKCEHGHIAGRHCGLCPDRIAIDVSSTEKNDPGAILVNELSFQDRAQPRVSLVELVLSLPRVREEYQEIRAKQKHKVGVKDPSVVQLREFLLGTGKGASALKKPNKSAYSSMLMQAKEVLRDALELYDTARRPGKEKRDRKPTKRQQVAERRALLRVIEVDSTAQ